MITDDQLDTTRILRDRTKPRTFRQFDFSPIPVSTRLRASHSVTEERRSSHKFQGQFAPNFSVLHTYIVQCDYIDFLKPIFDTNGSLH